MKTLSTSLLILLSMLLGGAAGAQPQVQIEGQPLARRLQLGGSELQLNGVGVREVAWFKAYVAGLYLTGKASSAEQVVALPGPKRIQLRMLHDVPTKELSKALRKGVLRNTAEADKRSLEPGLSALLDQIDAVGQVRKGDVVDLDFDGKGRMQFSLNSKPRGETQAAEWLYPAVLRSFVGEAPFDPKLKSGLLGHAAPRT